MGEAGDGAQKRGLRIASAALLPAAIQIVAPVAILLAISRPAQAEVRQPGLDAALARARREGKPLLIELSADWCGPCRYIDKQVISNPQVQRALQRFVFVRFDIDEARGAQVAAQLRSEGVPTFLAFDESGEVRARLSDIKPRAGVEWFLDFLRRAEAATRTEEALSRDLAANPEDARGLLSAARWYRARKRYDAALTYFRLAVEADSANRLGIASEAAWEGAQLGAALERRRRAVADAAALVDDYPGSRAATAALLLAALSGDLSAERTEELCASHVDALPDELEPLVQVAYIALAAGALEAALAVSKRLALLPAQSFASKRVVAEIHLYRGERDKARIAAIHACAGVESAPLLEACKTLRERIESAALESPGVEEMQGFADAYFDALERPETTVTSRRGTLSKASSKLLADWRRFRRAVESGFKEASRRCLRHYDPELPREVWVRLELAAADSPPKRVVVLEPDAPWRLERCIRGVLRKQPLPAPPDGFETQYTGPVVFSWKPWRMGPRNAPPPDYSVPLLEHTYAFLRGTTGLADEIGIGARSLLRFGKLADLHGMVQVDGHFSKVSDADYSCDANLLVGVGRSHRELSVSLLAGAGTSRVGDRLSTAFQTPVQVTLAYSGATLRGMAWARSVYVHGDSERGAHSHALFGANETDYGLGARIPARSHGGTFVGLSYGQALDQHRVAILLGVSLDSFAPR